VSVAPMRALPLQVVLRVLFVGALLALGVLIVTGGAIGRAGEPSMSLASSSLIAAPSPATTIAPSPTSPTSPSSPTTTIPLVHTGQSWASGWFVLLLVLTVVLGAACLRPMISRRARSLTEAAAD
jgi:hypothetical protein